jgi:hypothetical protein
VWSRRTCRHFATTHNRCAVIGAEEQRPVHVRQKIRIRTAASTADIFDECGPGGRAVTLPQLITVSAVIGAEEQRPVHVRQRKRRRIVASAADIFDERGPGGRAVTLPQLITVRAVIGAEEQRPVHVRQKTGYEPLPPLISLTSVVPADVPSLCHNSNRSRRHWR